MTNLAYVYRLRGRYHEAIEACKEAIRIDPDYAWAHYNLGLTYLKTGNKDGAQKQYEILKDLDRDSADKLLKAIHKGL